MLVKVKSMPILVKDWKGQSIFLFDQKYSPNTYPIEKNLFFFPVEKNVSTILSIQVKLVSFTLWYINFC